MIRSIVIATVVSGLAVGCNERKITQCNRLTEIANKTAGEVQTVVRDNAVPNNGAFLKVAAQYDQGKTDMQAVNFSDPQLQTYQQRFVEFYADVAKSARDIAQGMGEENPEAAKQAFQSATSLEVPLVQEVNTYCGSPASP